MNTKRSILTVVVMVATYTFLGPSALIGLIIGALWFTFVELFL